MWCTHILNLILLYFSYFIFFFIQIYLVCLFLLFLLGQVQDDNVELYLYPVWPSGAILLHAVHFVHFLLVQMSVFYECLLFPVTLSLISHTKSLNVSFKKYQLIC